MVATAATTQTPSKGGDNYLWAPLAGLRMGWCSWEQKIQEEGARSLLTRSREAKGSSKGQKDGQIQGQEGKLLLDGQASDWSCPLWWLLHPHPMTTATGNNCLKPTELGWVIFLLGQGCVLCWIIYGCPLSGYGRRKLLYDAPPYLIVFFRKARYLSSVFSSVPAKPNDNAIENMEQPNPPYAIFLDVRQKLKQLDSHILGRGHPITAILQAQS